MPSDAERVRLAVAHRLKYATLHWLRELKQLEQDGCLKNSAKYQGIWAEWICTAKQYNVVKRMRFK